ncbi:MAG: restriction endonuclease subunit S, partial [Actinomycetota bacterium]|nr:restriction endonuclease subunit S [Actinomycetota bacterium]
HELLMRASTVGTPGIGQPLTSLRSIPVVLPPLTEQRAIAEMLGALDDKIDCNQRIVRAAQDYVRALFEEVLLTVDSDPSVTTIGTVAGNERRSVDPSSLDPMTPYIGLEHMPQNDIALSRWDTAAKVTSGKMRFARGDVLFGKLRPYFHKVGIAQIDGVCSSDILVIRPVDARWATALALSLSSTAVIEYASAVSGGTRMPRVSWADLARYEIRAPRLEVLDSFERQARPIVETLRVRGAESRSLTTLRYALLPKLMSGELRLKHAEETVEAAV